MAFLKSKVIWILSPQAWGKMFISKHHYAIALASAGNKVYFINPPNDPRTEDGVEIKSVNDQPNLFLVNHSLKFPYNIKFHALPVFHWLMKRHIRRLEEVVERPDVIWSFDIGYLYPFNYFSGKPLKVFHPVDEPLAEISISSANGTDLIFSVTQEILAKYSHLRVPKHFIHHGLSHEFLNTEFQQEYFPSKKKRVGISGNLLRDDLDRQTLLQIVSQNPDIEFVFWGTYQLKESNIGGRNSEELELFISTLSKSSNVILKGALPLVKLAREYQEMDAFLICYDVEKDQSKGTNYHKIMEYLSTGKVIISNNVTTFKNEPAFMVMVNERDSNVSLPALFSSVMDNLESYNSPALMRQRREFAYSNSYEQQVEKIDKIISSEIGNEQN